MPNQPPSRSTTRPEARWERFAGFFVANKLVVFIFTALLFGAGLAYAPFRWDLGDLPRDPVPVDALPDISENQQIVFTKWPGRSPRDVEDQITYPLTTALLGLPGVESVRSSSVLGFSSIYVLFDEDVEFYWSRSRILEKLASLPIGTLPQGVAPTLGPDATALGQVYWYTLQPQDDAGRVVPGAFSLDELRSIQDWTVRYALQSVTGVSEVASVGGFVREYQVDVDPEAMLAHGVSIGHVAHAVREANLDVGARTIEINRAEYVVRGLGFIERPEDLEEVVIATREHRPIRVRDVARVSFGPALRRGMLDDGGAETVGGVVVVRFGANPMAVIEGLRAKIEEIAPGLPRTTLADGTVAQVHIVPFYDRTELINETLDTLSLALIEQVLITVVIVLLIMRHFRSSFLVSAVLPLGVLATFVLMKVTGINANVMALGGIAIAIGTMVDMGIVFTENIVWHLDADPEGKRSTVIRRGTGEVAGAVLTAILTTVLGFLPIFALSGSEGRLFTPLAYTKTFAIVAAFVLALTVLPAVAHIVLRARARGAPSGWPWLHTFRRRTGFDPVVAVALIVLVLALTDYWMPLGPGHSLFTNLAFVVLMIAGVMGLLAGFQRAYTPMLTWCLRHKPSFLAANLSFVLLGLTAWLGTPTLLGWLPDSLLRSAPIARLSRAMPGLGSDFMPPFDEGSFLYMPSTTPHASMGQAIDMIQHVDAAIAAIPEVDQVVGKLGRAESPLDPAPISMIETVVNYKSEYKLADDGRIARYAYDAGAKAYVRDELGHLVPDSDGRPFRQWRDHIRSSDDIWDEIAAATQFPGLTGAPKLMPIKTRIVMLQTGMRSAVGLKIKGPDLETLERFGLQLEALVKTLPQVESSTVLADRIVGKPYLEIDIDREAIARHGLTIQDVQNVIQVAIGGRALTQTVEGRERYPVRVRYMREERDSVEALGRISVPGAGGEQIPLEQLAEIQYVRGPQMIRSEDTFLNAYLTWDPAQGVGEVESVEAVEQLLADAIEAASLVVPDGVSYRFAGTYENQIRSQARLRVLVPVALAIIFVVLYLQFRRTGTALMVFSGMALAAAGAFLYLWLYGAPWFLDAQPFGVDLRELFRVGETRMTVAVWVGFLALFGIATDNGVIVATYLTQSFRGQAFESIDEIRTRVLEAGQRRVRPCLMTTATTLLALLPIVTSPGRGADLMVPMALPTVGGVGLALVTLLTVPVLFSLARELEFHRSKTSRS